jgi:hypothetical protein
MAVQSLPPPAVILAADYERAHAHDGAELVDEPALVGVGLVGLEQRLDEIRVVNRSTGFGPSAMGSRARVALAPRSVRKPSGSR